MSKQQAHQILDMARAGVAVPEEQIVRALVITGDLGAWSVEHHNPYTTEAT